MDFDVFRKRGRHWQYLGIYRASDSRSACKKAHRSTGAKLLAARPSDTCLKPYVHRFYDANKGKHKCPQSS